MGFGRSGSTLLEHLLYQKLGYLDLGEVKYFHQRVMLDNNLCTCNQESLNCPIWGSVAKNISVNEAEYVASNHDNYESSRNWVINTIRGARKDKYYQHHEKVLDLLPLGHKIDASKMPSRLYFLRKFLNRKYDVSVIWLCRHPAGTAYSQLKTVNIPNTKKTSAMPRQPTWYSSLQIVLNNILCCFTYFHFKNRTIVFYENLVEDPDTNIENIINSLKLKPAPTKEKQHLFSGNPSYFNPSKKLKIKIDEKWRTYYSLPVQKILAIPMILPRLVYIFEKLVTPKK